MGELVAHDLTLAGEEWRVYDFTGREYRIVNPVSLWTRPGGSTHRVLDHAGMLHIVPAPGFHGCVLRISVKEGHAPVAF